MPKLLISRASSNWIKYQQENKNTIAMAPMPRDTSWVHWAIVTYSERNRSAYLQFMFQVPWIEFPSPKRSTKEHVPWAVVLHETPHLNNHCWCHSMSQFHSHHGLFMPFREEEKRDLFHGYKLTRDEIGWNWSLFGFHPFLYFGFFWWLHVTAKQINFNFGFHQAWEVGAIHISNYHPGSAELGGIVQKSGVKCEGKQ